MSSCTGVKTCTGMEVSASSASRNVRVIIIVQNLKSSEEEWDDGAANNSAPFGVGTHRVDGCTSPQIPLNII